MTKGKNWYIEMLDKIEQARVLYDKKDLDEAVERLMRIVETGIELKTSDYPRDKAIDYLVEIAIGETH